MLKSIIAVAAILLSLITILFVIKRYTKASLIRFPKGIHTVSSLRYNAYSIVFEGQECTLKGVFIKKTKTEGNSLSIFISEDVRGAFTKPVQCNLAINQQANFEMLPDSANIVVVGRIAYTNGEVLLKEANIISF
jgi:hypothetical protein